jgi:hypothetical protein
LEDTENISATGILTAEIVEQFEEAVLTGFRSVEEALAIKKKKGTLPFYRKRGRYPLIRKRGRYPFIEKGDATL